MWLLAKYSNEPDFDNYVTILESIIKCEMNRNQYDRTKKCVDGFFRRNVWKHSSPNGDQRSISTMACRLYWTKGKKKLSK